MVKRMVLSFFLAIVVVLALALAVRQVPGSNLLTYLLAPGAFLARPFVRHPHDLPFVVLMLVNNTVIFWLVIWAVLTWVGRTGNIK
jgi:hypothetical protein